MSLAEHEDRLGWSGGSSASGEEDGEPDPKRPRKGDKYLSIQNSDKGVGDRLLVFERCQNKRKCKFPRPWPRGPGVPPPICALRREAEMNWARAKDEKLLAVTRRYLEFGQCSQCTAAFCGVGSSVIKKVAASVKGRPKSPSPRLTALTRAGPDIPSAPVASDSDEAPSPGATAPIGAASSSMGVGAPETSTSTAAHYGADSSAPTPASTSGAFLALADSRGAAPVDMRALRNELGPLATAIVTGPGGRHALAAHAWLVEHFRSTGAEAMPNAVKVQTTAASNVSAFFRDYQNEVPEEDRVSETTFRALAKALTKHWISFRKFLAVAGKCACCAALDQTMHAWRAQARPNAEIKNLALRKKLHHTHFVRLERAIYQGHREEARLRPNEVLSIIQDGMDSAKLHLPFSPGQNGAPSAALVPIKVQGVIVHHRRKVCFLVPPDIKGGANLALSTLALTLDMEFRSRGNTLPDTLFIQVDGGSENANLSTIAFLSHLVQRGVFSRIVASRLPVGHTHEDIDSMFGNIWKGIRDCHIPTPAAAVKAVRQSFVTGEPDVLIDFPIWDFDEYYNDHIPSDFKRFFKDMGSLVQGGSEHRAYSQHQYEITKNFSGQTVLRWRRHAADKVLMVWPPQNPPYYLQSVWYPSANEQPYVFLKGTPDGEPGVVELDKNIWRPALRKIQKQCIAEHRQPWKDFAAERGYQVPGYLQAPLAARPPPTIPLWFQHFMMGVPMPASMPTAAESENLTLQTVLGGESGATLVTFVAEDPVLRSRAAP